MISLATHASHTGDHSSRHSAHYTSMLVNISLASYDMLSKPASEIAKPIATIIMYITVDIFNVVLLNYRHCKLFAIFGAICLHFLMQCAIFIIINTLFQGSLHGCIL